MRANKEVSLQIQGMTCAACANKIEKGLNKIDGVVDANVNFAIEKYHTNREKQCCYNGNQYTGIIRCNTSY